MPIKDKEEAKRYNRERRAWYKAHGICTDCGRRPAFHKYVRCEYCLEKMSKFNVQTDEKRAYKREWTKKRIEQGLCLNCSNTVYEGSKRYCETCHSRYKAKQRIKKREKYQREHKSEERDAHNYEAWCKNLEIARSSKKWLDYLDKLKSKLNIMICNRRNAKLAKQGKHVGRL